MWVLRFAPVLAVQLAASLAWAEADPHRPSCEVVFGAPEGIPERKASREDSLRFVEASEGRVFVGRSDHAEPPRRVWLSGLELVEAAEVTQSATVSIDAEALNVACVSSDHPLHVDDALGDGAVLAILDDLVLLELHGEMVWWGKGEDEPIWSIVWVSDWAINPYRATSRAPLQKPNVPSPKRR